jgi:uncharacterized membrane protein (DUF106 family)
MAKSGMKKSNVHAKSESTSTLTAEQQAELKKIEEEDAKRKATRKKMMKETGRVMMGLYSILFAVLAWLVDYMGIFAAVSTILGIVGLIKMKAKKDKYWWMCGVAAVFGGIRFVWEMYGIITYLLK